METIPSSSTPCASGAEPPAPPALDDLARALLATAEPEAHARLLAAALAHHDHDTLLAHLKDESERYFTIDANASLRLADALIDAARLADKPRHSALGLLARGDALRTLGRYQEAHDTFEASGTAFLSLGDEVGWARTRTSWIAVCHFLGRSGEVLPVADQAHAILAKHKEWQRAAALDQNTALICEMSGRYNEALRFFNRAETTFLRLSSAASAQGLARARANKARLLSLFGEFAAALALHEEARAAFQAYGATLSVHREEHYIADILASQGDYTLALHRYSETLAAFDAEGLAAEAVWIALSMIECYLRLNRHREAFALAEETIERCESLGSPTEAARARFVGALALVGLGDHEGAARLLEAADHAFRTTGLLGFQGEVALLRAMIALTTDSWDEARVLSSKASATLAAQHLILKAAQADLVHARALLGLGDGVTAEGLARSALRTGNEREVPWLAHDAHAVLARSAHARADYPAALAACDAAIESIERVQSRLAIQLRSAFLADKLQVYHDAIDGSLRLSPPDPARAFGYLERAKSRALVDYLANNPDVHVRAPATADQPLFDQLRRLRAEHDWFTDRLYGYRIGRHPGGGAPSATIPEHEADAMRTQVRERERRITRLLERLTLREGAKLAGIAPMPFSWEDLRPHLDVGTVVLEYALHDEGSVVFVVTGDGLAAVPLAFQLDELQRLLSLWQLSLSATARALVSGRDLTKLVRNAEGVLSALYELLIAPVAGRLDACTRLIVIPYGPLHQLPFHALYDGVGYLIERFEISVAPSSALLCLCAERAPRNGRGALVLGYSDEGRLPGAVTEAQTIAALFPGRCFLEERATRAALNAQVSRHTILHLAAHGAARPEDPTFAHLRLADGRLTPADIFSLDLAGMLVILSACESGRATVQGGDELIGLSRAFLHAGAVTLIQSLWLVEDASSAQLMTRFYTALRLGESKGAALRSAQLALLRAGHAPFSWAPFQLLGANGPLARTGGLPAETLAGAVTERAAERETDAPRRET